jgi:hypothetical protein
MSPQHRQPTPDRAAIAANSSYLASIAPLQLPPHWSNLALAPKVNRPSKKEERA